MQTVSYVSMILHLQATPVSFGHYDIWVATKWHWPGSTEAVHGIGYILSQWIVIQGETPRFAKRLLNNK
jgi:hypothetical protein